MYTVQYRTATHVSQVSNSLAGSFSYYADPVKALDTGRFVEKRVVWTEDPYDFLGERFRAATNKEIDQLARKRI